MLRHILFGCIIVSVFLNTCQAQAGGNETPQENMLITRDEAPRVFLDCNFCDRTYIRREITFVNYVRDREEADVHVLVTLRGTGGGGREYTFNFIGLNEYERLNQELIFNSSQTDTSDEIRQGLTRRLLIGLVPYIARTPMAEQLSIGFEMQEDVKPVTINDPWNNWVFDIDGYGSFNSEETQSRYNVGGSVSADRITEQWRFRSEMYTDHDLRRFENEGDIIESTSTQSGFFGTLVKSLGDHWSTGVSGNAQKTTFRNLDLGLRVGPSVEYSFYPYAQSARRELTLTYHMRYNYQDYIEETIFEKTQESLAQEALELRLRINQPWGTAQASLEGSHYFHDLSKNSVEFNGRISVRLFKGLSVRFSGGMEVIHDQLYLAQDDASLEEVLLRRKQLATTYEVSGSVGLSYTFGSIYNNIVNTRL